MTLEEFKKDDRYGVIDITEIAFHGGTRHGIKLVCTAAAWLLAPENSVGFDAVLDTDDMQVATLEDGYVVWTPLADFEVQRRMRRKAPRHTTSDRALNQ